MIQYVGDLDSQAITDLTSTITYTVEELIPFTEYSFSVAAVNSIGTGSFSEQPLTLRTPESSEFSLIPIEICTLSFHSSWCSLLLPLSSHQLK